MNSTQHRTFLIQAKQQGNLPWNAYGGRGRWVPDWVEYVRSLQQMEK